MNQNSIVLELQEYASGSKINLTELLRKALLVSRKLKLEEFTTWIRNELNGYDSDLKDIPKYRKIHSDIQAHHPRFGISPVRIGNARISEIIHTVPMGHTIATLETLLNHQAQIK